MPRRMPRSLRTEELSRLRMLADDPPVLETPIETLGRSAITPAHDFFVRNHGDTPLLDHAAWRLSISGLVRRAGTLDLAALHAVPAVEEPVTLECAGNGRSHFGADLPGVPWNQGGVGTAVWKGARLRDVLERCGLETGAAHVWFEAADRVEGTQKFLRSLPLEKALADTLIVWSMNGRPIPPEHGGPVRAIVPGWYAMASTKWLTGLRVEAEPVNGEHMARAYQFHYQREGRTWSVPVDEMRIKSLVTFPLEGALLPAGIVEVRGYAWGGRPVREVCVSADGGLTWNPAELESPIGSHAWTPWHAHIERAPGPVTLLARATDVDGVAQPLWPIRNRDGYGYNGVVRVRFEAI